MCQGGVNTAQLATMVGMADDSIALAHEWLDEIHHLAGHAELKSTDALAQARAKLEEAGALLSSASDELEGAAQAEGFEVTLV